MKKTRTYVRVCAVFTNGIRRFYKCEVPVSEKSFINYATHFPPLGVPSPLQHDQPCCFHNGRFVRVNRDNSRSVPNQPEQHNFLIFLRCSFI